MQQLLSGLVRGILSLRLQASLILANQELLGAPSMFPLLMAISLTERVVLVVFLQSQHL